MQLITRPTTCWNFKIECWEAGHTFYASILVMYGSIRFSRMRLVSKNSLSCLRNRLRTAVVFLWRAKLVTTIFFLRNLWWSSLWRRSFHSDCCSVNDGILCLFNRWLCFVWVRARFLLAVKSFFTVGDAVWFFSKKVLQIECLRGVSTQDMMFRWHHDFKRRLSWQNCEFGSLRGGVYSLCIPVSMFLHSFSKIWSQSTGLCQLLLRNLPLVTLEQRFCCFRCLAFCLPRQLDVCGGSTSWDRLQKLLVLRDYEFFPLFWSNTKHTLRRRCIIDCMPKQCEWWRSLFDSYSESEWAACPSWTCDLLPSKVQHIFLAM